MIHKKMNMMRDKSIMLGQSRWGKFAILSLLPKSEKFSFLGNGAPNIIKNN